MKISWMFIVGKERPILPFADVLEIDGLLLSSESDAVKLGLRLEVDWTASLVLPLLSTHLPTLLVAGVLPEEFASVVEKSAASSQSLRLLTAVGFQIKVPSP